MFWDFFQHLFGEVSASNCLVELNELNNVTLDSSASTISEHAIVSIEFLHLGKICISDTDNNDRTRERRKLDNRGLSFRHVIDDTVC